MGERIEELAMEPFIDTSKNGYVEVSWPGLYRYMTERAEAFDRAADLGEVRADHGAVVLPGSLGSAVRQVRDELQGTLNELAARDKNPF